MRAQPVDLIGGFYTSDSLPWSCQDTVNWLPVMAEVAGTRTVSMFATPPGLKPYQQIGTGPIRGMHDCEGLRLIVSGRYLYRISNTGVGVPLGIIPGVGRVQMTHNQFKTGYQVLVENGQGGGGYVYNTVDDTFAKITDEGYPGSISSDYLDSYLLGVEPQGRFWFHSNLADATDYNTLDRYEAEAAPDKIVGLAVSQFEVVVFGQRTIEFFFNAGGQTGTFQNRRQSITRGCASRHTIQKLDNTLFWLGDDGVVYRMEGYAARPVSTRALEKAISGYNWAEAIAFTWEDRGHKVYYLTFPDGQTFGYDVVSGLWHRRESFGINRWRLSHTQKWGRDWFGGDFQNGRTWQLDWDYFLEGDQPIISERSSGVVADNQSALLLPNAELIFDTGHGPPTAPIAFPAQPSMPVLSGQLPVGYVENAYSYTIPVSGGTAPYTFAVVDGTLPSGLSLTAATGVISGVPSQSFSGAVTIRVTDSAQMWDEKSYQVEIYSTLPAFMDQARSYRMQADGTYVLYGSNPIGSGGTYLGLTVSRSAKYIAGPMGTSTIVLSWAKLNGAGTQYTLLPSPPQPTTGTCRYCRFNPDGKFLAVLTSTTLFVYAVNQSDDTLSIVSSSAAGTDATTVSWRADGKRVIVGTSSGGGFNWRAVYVVDSNGVIGSRYSPATSVGAQSGIDFDWSPDSKYVAERNNTGLYIWLVTDSAITLQAQSSTGSGRGAYFSADGQWVYSFGSGAASARRYPFSSGSLGTASPTTWQNSSTVNDSSISSDKTRITVATSGTPSLPVLLTHGGDLVLDANQPPTPTTTSTCVRWTSGESDG
ncbi:putative Ig domain-containing protein [Stenotrophomonas hibiscicola]|uniref:putative Ig domain-containing protein n=1 Tax=Stenotrophomonas hibiscicola TaxID=86189 RepID=UPI00036C4C54|nr:putative Ig domain-containing protein [[Pseudomonas] hibiscicola]